MDDRYTGPCIDFFHSFFFLHSIFHSPFNLPCIDGNDDQNTCKHPVVVSQRQITYVMSKTNIHFCFQTTKINLKRI